MQNNNEYESELIARSLNGDTDAYGVLVGRYKNVLYHHCFAIVRNEDVAEDMTQETFIAAYYKLTQYNPRYRLSTWLFKIATNRALSWLRKTRREVRDANSVIAALASEHPGPEQLAIYGELYRAMDHLQARYRAVISLFYWQGLCYEEIAMVLGAPVGSVRGWMHRAKIQLKKELS